jgi:hypothetical protein
MNQVASNFHLNRSKPAEESWATLTGGRVLRLLQFEEAKVLPKPKTDFTQSFLRYCAPYCLAAAVNSIPGSLCS